MILNSTKYKNPERTIVGLLNFVTNADTIILCDTSVGAVALELLSIPNDQWSTTYSIYVIDNSNNASVNNITINAPVGYTINNQSSLTINTNGGSVVIKVASNTGYLGSLTSGGTSGGSVSVVNQQNPFTPPNLLTSSLSKLTFKGLQSTVIGNEVTISNDFVSVSAINLNSLITSKTLIPNQWYNVTDAIFGSGAFSQTVNVFVCATSTDKINSFGLGQFYNADYNGIGNYSGITGFNSQLGVWYAGLGVAIGDVAIWYNLMYANTTGVNTSTPPNLDTTNWKLLSFSETNGYILVSNEISYYSSANIITSRKDNFLNEVVFAQSSGLTLDLNALNVFRWGDSGITLNTVTKDGIFSCCNVQSKSIQIRQNTIISSQIYFGDPDNNLGGTSGEFSNNIFENNSANILYGKTTGSGNFRKNKITLGGFLIDNAGSIDGNVFSYCYGYINNNDGNASISDAEMHFCQLAIDNQGNIGSSQFIACPTTFVNALNAQYSSNYALNCELHIENSFTTFTNNTFKNSYIETTNFSGFRHNNIENSTFVLLNNNAEFGGYGTLAPLGNNIRNSNFTISTNQKQISSNTIEDSKIVITTNNGSIQNNYFLQQTEITILSNTGDLENLSTYGANFGSGLNNSISFNGGTYQKGNLSIAVTLDCSQPSIYNSGTQTLTIPSAFRDFAGIFYLDNASGITITKIINISTIGEQTIYSNNGIVTFITNSVTIGYIYEIVSNRPAPYSYLVTHRTNGNDYIKIINSGIFNCVTNSNAGIFV
jgi:hypothetical protein